MDKTERTTLLVLGVAALTLTLTAPASAQAPADRDWEPTLAVLNGAGTEAVLFGPAPARGASIDGPSALGTVTAECCDGSTVTCQGSSGSFQDADCDVGQRGYCSTAEEGTKYCPSCSSPSCVQGCSSAPSCEDLNGTSCFSPGTSTPCSTSDGSCSSCSCTSTNLWMCLLSSSA